MAESSSNQPNNKQKLRMPPSQQILHQEPQRKDSYPQDIVLLDTLSSKVYNRRLIFAFGLPLVFVVFVGVWFAVASPLVAALVSVLWVGLHQAICRYAPSVEKRSKALQQSCYSLSFVSKLVVGSIIVVALSPFSWTPPSLWILRCRFAYVYLVLATVCVLFAAYIRYRTPFALLQLRTSCSCIGSSSPFRKEQSLAAAFVAFLSEITSSAEEPNKLHTITTITSTRTTTANMSRTVYLTTADTVAREEPSSTKDSSEKQHLLTNKTSTASTLFQMCCLQILSHAVFGSLFGIFFFFAITSITPGNIQQSYSSNNTSTLMAALAGIASFVGFLSTILPMDQLVSKQKTALTKLRLDPMDMPRCNPRRLDIHANKDISFLTTVWKLVHCETTSAILISSSHFVRIGCSLILGFVGLNFLVFVWDRTYYNDVEEETSSFVESVVLILFQLYLVSISILVYTCGVYISVLVDTFGRVVLCQPLHLKSLAKEYRRNRIIPNTATNVPIPTRLFLDYFLSSCCQNSHEKKIILERLVSSRNNTTSSHQPWTDPDSLEAQRIEDVMHLLADSWKSNVGNTVDISTSNAMCWTWILESFGGRIMSPLHSSNIKECLSLNDGGIIMTRCLLAMAGAYGMILSDIVVALSSALQHDETTTNTILCPAAAYQAEISIRGAARMIAASSRSSRQSTMILSLLRTAHKLHRGACCYVDRIVQQQQQGEISTTRSSSGGVSSAAAPLQQIQMQENVSKATYILQQVAGSDERLRKLCAYELDQMRVPLGKQLGCLVVLYRLLVAADEAILPLSGVIRKEGLDRSCRAWIDGVLAAAVDQVK